MIDKIEDLALRLIPYRKWMLISFLISLILVMPISIFLTVYLKTPIFFFIGGFLLTLGFTWSWGLFLISLWYNPNGGLLTFEKIKEINPIFQWQASLMRYCAPFFLIIWFLSPVIVLGMLYSFIKITGK